MAKLFGIRSGVPGIVHASAHNYSALVARWKKVARAAGLKMRTYAESGGFEIVVIESSVQRSAGPRLYLSAGIHGDESATTEALIGWAAENIVFLRSAEVVVFPCLNPWGLVNNSRLDCDGRDLNRCYRDESVPQIRAQLAILNGRKFDAALMLHEDFDGHGYYLYEILSQKSHWGGALIQAAAKVLPPDRRSVIEGHRASGGVIRRKISPEVMPHWPEAFPLHFHHARRTFTVEAPSEFHIDDRVAAHVEVINEFVRRACAEVGGGVGSDQ